MPTYQIFKETAVPGTLAPNAIYLVAPAANPNHLEIYVTNAAGDAQRHTQTIAEVQAMIDASLSASAGGYLVDDIAARDALTPSNAETAYVIDATADPTVTTGGATYIYRASNTSWIKQAEAESLDINLAWGNITGGPSSSPAQIDAAVTATHTHTNKTQLDKVGEDANGFMSYDGDSLVVTGSTAW